MKPLAFIFSIVMLAVTSCTSGPTATPHITEIRPIPPTPRLTPTAGPQAMLSQAATLYSGPGNVNYESVANLPSSLTVNLSGTYGDFVKVVAAEAGDEVTGFVRKDTLANLPGDLPVLDRLQVPWEPFFIPTCSPGEYDAASGTVTFASISADEGFYTNSAYWAVTAPIRIQIKALEAQGSTWTNKRSNTEWSDVKITGSTDLTIRSRADDGKYELDIHKSIGGDVAKAIVLGQSSSRPIQILFDQPADNRPTGTSLSVLDEAGQVLTTVDLARLSEVNLPDGLFPDGRLYFGTDTAVNSSLVVTGLTIGSQPTGHWVDQANTLDYLNSPGLAKLAEGKQVTMANEFLLDRAIDRRYCQTMQHDFNVAVVGDFTYKWFWLGEGEYAWGPVDRAVDFANQHGWRVRAYVGWGSPEALPDWLLNSNHTRDEYITILENHIKTVMEHFRGRVQEWMIANEAIERSVCERADFYDFWYRKIGPDYFKVAFQTAREANPRATLILNSSANYPPNYPPFMNCLNPTIKKMHDTVIELNSGATRLVDGIGMQMHILSARDAQVPPSKADVIKIMRDFSKLGVRAYITEMDVNLNFMQSKYPTQVERWKIQAGIYKDMVDACLESGACASFATQGISDSMSWITTSCPGCWNEPAPNGDPLMFDVDFLPKPAYFAVSDALANTEAPATPSP